MSGAVEKFTINSVAGATDTVTVNAITAANDLNSLTVVGDAAGITDVVLNGTAANDLSATFGAAGTAINIGANVNSLTVNNSGVAMAAVDISANVAPVVTINNDFNVIFAAAAVDNSVTDLTVDISTATTGRTVDFSSVVGLLPVNTEVILGANNGFADQVNITGVSLITDITNVVTVRNFEAGAGTDTINVTNAGLTIYTINLNATSAGTFIGDVNAAITTQLGGAYTDLAGDVVVANVTGSGALDGVYAISDTTAAGLINNTAEVVQFVDIVGTLAAVDFV